MFKFEIYTIGENETLSDISKKNNISVDEILQFNFLLRNCSIYKGKTILIPYKNIENTLDNRLEINTSNEIIDYKLLFYFKNILDCMSNTKEHASYLVKSYNEYKSSLNYTEITYSFINFNDNKLLKIANLISNNNQSIIPSIINEIKNNYYKNIKNNTNNKEIITKFYNLALLWTKYIFKVFSKQYKESELIFKKIIST